MATFVLVHGAWHGGWSWAKTEHALRGLGHETFAPTLTGCGESNHLLSPEINADLHVLDVVNFIKWRELQDVYLVGHSYGGIVITGVAGQIPELLRARIYLDAFVPEESGVSIFSRANPERLASFKKQMANGAKGIAPDNFDAWTDDPEIRLWLEKQCTLQPFATFTDGVTLTGREAEVPGKFYIAAARNRPSPFWPEFERLKARPDWHCKKIATKHDAMVEAPDELSRMFASFVTLMDAQAQAAK